VLQHRKAIAIIPLVLGSLVGCAVDPTATTTTKSSSVQGDKDLTALPAIQSDPELAKLVPAELKTTGLQIATSSNLPPMTYIDEDSKTAIGFDVDIAKSIGKVLDVKTDIRTVGFDTIIPGLSAGRFTVALSSIGVTDERLKTVDFVNYYRGGQGFLASKATDFAVTDLKDLCGHRVAVGSGSVQESTLQKDEVNLCKDSGREPWQVQVFPDNNAGVLAIRSGRADVLYASISIVAYSADQNDQLRIAGRYKRTTVGAALPKDSPLGPAVQKAVQKLIDDGTYAKLLQKWGLEDNAIKTAEINTVLPAS